MFARRKSRGGTSARKVTPPSPSYMSNEHFCRFPLWQTPLYGALVRTWSLAKQQPAAYLAELRSNRVNRPGGVRPEPSYTPRDCDMASTPECLSFGSQSAQPETSFSHPPSQSHVRKPSGRPSLVGSVLSRNTMMNQGRDYVPEKSAVKPLRPSEIVPTATYMERGQRWMEKEEAFSLRHAMEDMDINDEINSKGNFQVDDESRIYNAALNEAAELVWRHEHPEKGPQPNQPYRYRPHLRKNSYAHARTASAGLYGEDVAPTGLARDASSRSVSGSSSGSDGIGANSMNGRQSFGSSRRQSAANDSQCHSLEQPTQASTSAKKPYGALAGSSSVANGERRRSSMKRNISGEVKRPFSGDQIWEEPEGTTPQRYDPMEAMGPLQPVKMKPRDPPNRVQFAPDVLPSADHSDPPLKPLSKFEIYRNPPTQSRNPQYTVNLRSAVSYSSERPACKEDIEVRSRDVRQATSKNFRDRSPKLPTPSAVSNVPGRPIVSFNKNWTGPEDATDHHPGEPTKMPQDGCLLVSLQEKPFNTQDEQQQHLQQQWKRQRLHRTEEIPTISVSEDITTSTSSSKDATRTAESFAPSFQPADGSLVPPISVFTPSISVLDCTASPPTPRIALDGEDSPAAPNILVTVTTGDETKGAVTRALGPSRPLPTPKPNASRHPATARSRGHDLRVQAPAFAAGRRATARCHQCDQPVEGRFVSLAGIPERFHPSCFTCYTCDTPLEALEISPEPESHRSARLGRIAARARGEILPEGPGETMGEDGDGRLRFYCHLDWAEQFAPQCRHCKTPILGEAVVALGGAKFHPGHFFCAECGDPFGAGDTHIEVEGYAWCVGCMTKRTERRAPKCRACKGPVVGEYVQALGGEWHDSCFLCATCGGGFEDGQIFPVEGRGVLCTGCRLRELKA